ncbi:vacuolar-type H+-ATPase subunit E/Vma4 [Amorphus suaedae]
MAEIVNLRSARKARMRADEKDRAAENRARHGLTKAEKQAEAARRTQSETHLDRHRLDSDD